MMNVSFSLVTCVFLVDVEGGNKSFHKLVKGEEESKEYTVKYLYGMQKKTSLKRRSRDLLDGGGKRISH